jgi:hypothetical protein
MSGFNTFTYNGSPIINSLVDYASINLPTTKVYIPNQYNLLAPTIDGNPGYVLQTNNNIISIADGSNGFYINNPGIYKISLCFSFDNSNRDSGNIVSDFMLNASYPYTSTDIVGTNTILNVKASGAALSFDNLYNQLPLSGEQISDNDILTGGNPNPRYSKMFTYTYNINPIIMYCNDPDFFFARYFLSTTNQDTTISQVLRFESTVNITSTTDNSNYFYPCICPYAYTMWNTGDNSYPQSSLSVQMISSVPVS